MRTSPFWFSEITDKFSSPARNKTKRIRPDIDPDVSMTRMIHTYRSAHIYLHTRALLRTPLSRQCGVVVEARQQSSVPASPWEFVCLHTNDDATIQKWLINNIVLALDKARVSQDEPFSSAMKRDDYDQIHVHVFVPACSQSSFQGPEICKRYS